MPVPKTPLLTVDCVVFDARNRVLFIRRKNPPFAGSYALPGGFVDIGETVEDACRRELAEETGVKVKTIRLINVYSAPDRDPRGHTCSVAFWARVNTPDAKAGDDAASLEWVSGWRSADLAFDHKRIVMDAFRTMRSTEKG